MSTRFGPVGMKQQLYLASGKKKVLSSPFLFSQCVSIKNRCVAEMIGDDCLQTTWAEKVKKKEGKNQKTIIV